MSGRTSVCPPGKGRVLLPSNTVAIAATTSSRRMSFALMRSPTRVGFSGMIGPLMAGPSAGCGSARPPRGAPCLLVLTGLRVVGRHLTDNLRGERDALPEAVKSGSLGEVATIQDNQVAVDQVGGDRVRDGVLKRLVERVFGRDVSHRYIKC